MPARTPSLLMLTWLLALLAVAAEPAATQATDREELRRIIREELKAEQDKEKAQKEKDESRWFEVGQHLDLKSVIANGFHAETPDKAFRFHFGGRLEWDNAWFSQDDNLLIGPSAGT